MMADKTEMWLNDNELYLDLFVLGGFMDHENYFVPRLRNFFKGAKGIKRK